MKEDTVSKTRKLNLCVSCEACKYICPVDAITLVYEGGQFVPEIDDSCTHCGKCLEVCPGIDIETQEVDPGPYISVYDAYVPNKIKREKSTSGGVITTLLSWLLKDKTIDIAFVLDFDTFNGKPARLKPVSNPKEVIKYAGSKYTPASIFEILNNINDYGKYVVVGTPCQIDAIKKTLKIKKCNAEIIYFGLFCDRTMNFNFINYMQDRYAKRGEKTKKIQFRNKEKNGWPGDVKLVFDSGRTQIINRNRRMEVKDYFMLERCLYCVDKLNNHADISFGDCYLKGKNHPERTSIIVRTKKGREILNNYAHLLKVNESSIEGISLVQGLKNRKEQLKWAKESISSNVSSDLVKRKKMIRIGRNYSLTKIMIHLKLNFLKKMYEFFRREFKVVKYLLIGTKKISSTESGNILIFGGELSNKGAQAMTFTTVSNILKFYPHSKIYLLSNNDFYRDKIEKELYPFHILPWSKDIKLEILEQKNKEFLQILRKTDMVLDISGYRLSSQWGLFPFGSYDYLLDILIAKTFSIPYYILPQSIGPFKYKTPDLPIIYTLLKKYLKYPQLIYVREKPGFKVVNKYTKSNLKLHHDMVLTESYDISQIFKGKEKNFQINEPAAGIITNLRAAERTNLKKMMEFYKKAIKRLRKNNFSVYLILHSNEDVELITKLKEFYQSDENVIAITEELHSFELEKIIAKMNLMIASRYHSIIHAYRNEIPCLVLGWAVKYKELLNDFSQSEYNFDARKHLDNQKMLKQLDQLIKKRSEEKIKIRESLKLIRLTEENIFEEIVKLQEN